MFVFQAEDGIRDSGVTGVQTCALPISTRSKRSPASSSSSVVSAEMRGSRSATTRGVNAWLTRERSVRCLGGSIRTRGADEGGVGEGGRFRWGPQHLKKQ